jgi:hypothetical protein
VSNKAPQGWKITDFNNVLNENPFFPEQAFWHGWLVINQVFK